ncbi:tetratricopeptide repeat protein [Algoriphagus kandeliae]|uniref:Tetratricopeptide repeat protein n=1 Tax=Algoriphagus kandeliae TaxID=2562278 RepID=A0A4Y9QYM1_9BACT|nr:tetratricopeptide repeat protein [Algoriphagus kandeliae]TFV97469.1 tetratricopeptide repeat protein [Algoriphagus kandeliae]
MHKAKSPFLGYLPALLFVLLGGLFSYYYLLFDPVAYRVLLPGYFLDRLPIPFDWAGIGPLSFPILIDNFLVFQEFQSFAPNIPVVENQVFGILAVISISFFLALISSFKKWQFLAAGIAWIILLVFSNLNGLNINGINSNYPLIIAIIGNLAGPVFFHLEGKNRPLLLRWIVILLLVMSTTAILLSYSPLPYPAVFLSEHSFILLLGLSIAWIFWNGHAILSGTYILLTRANKNLGLRVSIQFLVLGILYLLLLFNMLLDLTGLPITWIPTFHPLVLVIPVGVMGWLVLRVKSKNELNPSFNLFTLESLHLLGFGITLWVIWKLKLVGNQPAEELLKHLITYSQIGFSAFFMIYVFSNFFTLMDSGKDVERVLFKPFSLPYYHLRLGGLIAMLVLTTYADGIIGVQVNALSNQVLGDYYYETDQKLEASILYENAWFRCRNNPKAKNALAHLLLELKQPSLAKSHLEQSFSEAPQEDNIVLLADRYHQEQKLFQAISTLEQGLSFFPKSEAIRNNLALLYVKSNRTEEAKNLLEEAPISQLVSKNNLLATQLKSGQLDMEAEQPKGLPGFINELAHQHALGNFPSKNLIESTEKAIQKSETPLLTQAALRNLFSILNQPNPEEDLALLDSLWQKEEMNPYIMSLQETAVIRSLSAGRVGEAIKNLNGLAFRNPGDAGYFLHLSASILAQQLDFKKSSAELLAAREKGFQAFKNHHWEILVLGGFEQEAEEIRLAYNLDFPAWIQNLDSEEGNYLQIIEKLHEALPEELFGEWDGLENEMLKADLAAKILRAKSHGLNVKQIQELAVMVNQVFGENEDLKRFAANPDFQNQESVQAFLNWLKLGDELTGNPYYSPLIWSAQLIQSDPLVQYEILNAATEFNRDPILWMKKVQVARQIGLSNYATDALGKMSEWIDEETLYQLQMRKF